MSYGITFSSFKAHFEGDNYFQVHRELSEYARLKGMYIGTIEESTGFAPIDIDENRINVRYQADGTITEIFLDKED
jgi:hypothetical protein